MFCIFVGARVEELRTEIRCELAMCLEKTEVKGKKHLQYVADKFGINPAVVSSLKSFEELWELLRQQDVTIAELLNKLNELGCNNSCNKLSKWILQDYQEAEPPPSRQEPGRPVQEEGEEYLCQPIPETRPAKPD